MRRVTEIHDHDANDLRRRGNLYTERERLLVEDVGLNVDELGDGELKAGRRRTGSPEYVGRVWVMYGAGNSCQNLAGRGKDTIARLKTSTWNRVA